MIVRALDQNHDWTFGAGRNNYLSGNKGIGQSINTRLSSFLGDCFFNTGAGIDWWNLLGGKNQLALNLAISATILNTSGVLGIQQLAINLDRSTRRITVQYNVNTIYSTLTQTFQYNIGT